MIIDGEPWFVAKDVCDVLEYARSNDAVTAHCKYPKILKHGETPYLKIPARGTYIVNEPDLYRLVINSEMPKAEEFERWVMEEVLPTIRKTGGYMTAEAVADFYNKPGNIISFL